MSPIPHDQPISHPDTHIAAAHVSEAVDRIDLVMVASEPKSLPGVRGADDDTARPVGFALDSSGKGVNITPDMPYALVCTRLGRWWGPFRTLDDAAEMARVHPALEDASIVAPPAEPSWYK